MANDKAYHKSDGRLSTYQMRGGKETEGYQGSHRLEDKLAGSDLPARGAGLDTQKITIDKK